jgi:outer membrane protein OmpA-like peptidoglycan-associated protein
VKQYLVDKGIADRPPHHPRRRPRRADRRQRHQDGKAKNRRIEFKLHRRA